LIVCVSVKNFVAAINYGLLGGEFLHLARHSIVIFCVLLGHWAAALLC